jgi:hypothetical protein
VPFVHDRISSVGFPDGVPTTPGLDIVSAFSTLYLWTGSAVIGPIATHGMQAVLGFFLTATVTYLFVRQVTGSVGSGFVAGLAYGFSPHLYSVARVAPTYTHMWLFVLPLWAFWNLSRAPGRRTALIAGASIVPAMFWTPYYTLHVLAVGGACLSVLVVLGPRIGFTRRMLTLVAAPCGLALALYVGVGVLTSFSDAPDRPVTDFYQQAAHPLMFVWPGFGSIFWGGDVTQVLVDLVPRASFTNVYLGLSVLLLGAFGAWTALREWVGNRLDGAPSPEGVAALLALATVLISFLCSLPPRVLHGVVPTPASLIFEVAPGLRAGQRFVMPMMAGTSLLAGLGASAFLRRLPRAAVLPATLALALVVGVDLHTRIPGMTDEAPARTPALDALAKAPDGPVLQISPEGFFGGTAQLPCLMQNVHHKALVNTCGFATPPRRVLRVGDKPICVAIADLRRFGLRYVVAHPAPPPPNVAGCFHRDTAIGPWRTLARDSHTWVFELVGR